MSTYNLFTRELSFTSRMPLSSRLAFFDSLAMLTSAGVELSKALLITKAAFKGSGSKSLIDQIHQQLILGSTFNEALLQSGSFEMFEIQSIRVAEETGNLPKVLGIIASYYMRKAENRAKLITSVTYPAVVLGVAIISVVVMLAGQFRILRIPLHALLL